LSFNHSNLQSRQTVEKLSDRFSNLVESSGESKTLTNDVSIPMKKPIEIVNLNSEGFPVATTDSVFVVEEVIDVTVDVGDSSSLPLAEYLAKENKPPSIAANFQFSQADHHVFDVNHLQPQTLPSFSPDSTLLPQPPVFYINQGELRSFQMFKVQS
jgi:hypothetical protein